MSNETTTPQQGAGFSVAGKLNPVVEALRTELDGISKQAEVFFDHLSEHIEQAREKQSPHDFASRFDWSFVTEDQQKTAQDIRRQLADFGVRLIDAIQKSSLLEPTDVAETKRLLKAMSSSLLLKEYEYHESYVVSEEDKVYGIQPAGQEERRSNLSTCRSQFRKNRDKILEKMDLLSPKPEDLPGAIVATQAPGIIKSRKGTAFIIMQIDPAKARLEDIKNAIKEVFKRFGVEAKRSDEIEHSGMITQRILDEITTSEFLIADLSGERPSVYYEVGYAHAIGKYPILFREEGAPLHFDLKVFNAPEYENITDLKQKLYARLSSITGRNP